MPKKISPSPMEISITPEEETPQERLSKIVLQQLNMERRLLLSQADVEQLLPFCIHSNKEITLLSAMMFMEELKDTWEDSLLRSTECRLNLSILVWLKTPLKQYVNKQNSFGLRLLLIPHSNLLTSKLWLKELKPLIQISRSLLITLFLLPTSLLHCYSELMSHITAWPSILEVTVI